MTQIINSLDEISDNYEAVFCDLWGCLHDGYTPFASAVSALETFRDAGKTVLLLTNSPRPKEGVIRQLRKIGVADDLWHEIATSGDSARFALANGMVGRQVYHLGPEHDYSFFEPGQTELLAGLKDIKRVSLDQSEGIVCTGLVDDETESPEDYRAILLEAKNRGLKLLCANPDIIVDRGTQRVFCAGAMAQLYTEMGGESLYFGKPHPPIYQLARTRLSKLLGRVVADEKILCIGDGVITDAKGAMGEDLDCLFITGGLAAAETATVNQPDPALLQAFLTDAQLNPRFSIGHLR